MKIPETREEWLEVKAMFIKRYEVEDEPPSWLFILSQIQGTKMPDLAFEPNNVFKHYKRWKIGKMLHDERAVYMAELETKLEEKIAEVQKEIEREGAASPQGSAGDVSIGTPPSEAELPRLPENETGVVQTPSVPGV